MGEATVMRRFSAAYARRAGWQFADLSAPLSVRAHMVGMIFVIIVPLMIFSGFLVLRSAANEQEMLASNVRARTREAAVSIEHTLYSLRARLFLFAGSRHLATGDFVAFRERALETARPDDLALVLSDAAGRQIINTHIEPGEDLPDSNDRESVRRVIDTSRPDVSDQRRDAASGNFIVDLSVPILRDGQVAYVLSLNIAPLLPRMLAELDVPPEWLVTLVDRTGRTIARSREADRFVGEMGRPAALDQFRRAQEGWFALTSRDGIPLSNAFAHVPISGWTVSVGIPDDVLFAPVRHWTWLLLLAGGLALTLALLMATAIGRRISGGIAALSRQAEAVGQGKPAPFRSTGLKETDALARTLDAASDQLLRGAQERAVLLHRTVTAQEAERKRIARELHDSPGQYLTALRLGFGAIERQCGSNQAVLDGLGELKRLTTRLGRDLSRIAWELRPMALDDLGLHRAITQYLEEWAERSNLRIDFENNLHDRRLPQAIEIALFRVLQEAVTNVIRHAGATSIGVIVDADQSEVRLIVEDDGRGFDAGNDTDGPDLGTKHFGLLGIRERLGLVGGSLEVESSEQHGTTVYVRIPL